MDHAHALPAAPRWLDTLKIWSLHLLAFAVPLLVLAFVITGPHPWYASLPWLAVIPLFVVLDNKSGPAQHFPREDMPAWPFDIALVLLIALQLANIALMGRMLEKGGLFSADTLVAAVLVGANSGYSAIVVAHECIHRKSRVMRWLGRLLLWTVLYDHFSIEHVRGHHARIATFEDPATARFGESYAAFWRRTVPAQFRSAWRLEAKRLGDENMRFFDRRTLKNTVLFGIVAECALALGILFAFGIGAFVTFLLQAYVAVRLLETVNYFEHYGLRRAGRRVRPVDSWDSDSYFTLFALVGLSRHADHHAYASRPYQALRLWEESPKLPRGYIGMVAMVLTDNARAQKLMHAELERRKLGPFAQPNVAA